MGRKGKPSPLGAAEVSREQSVAWYRHNTSTPVPQLPSSPENSEMFTTFAHHDLLQKLSTRNILLVRLWSPRTLLLSSLFFAPLYIIAAKITTWAPARRGQRAEVLCVSPDPPAWLKENRHWMLSKRVDGMSKCHASLVYFTVKTVREDPGKSLGCLLPYDHEATLRQNHNDIPGIICIQQPQLSQRNGNGDDGGGGGCYHRRRKHARCGRSRRRCWRAPPRCATSWSGGIRRLSTRGEEKMMQDEFAWQT